MEALKYSCNILPRAGLSLFCFQVKQSQDYFMPQKFLWKWSYMKLEEAVGAEWPPRHKNPKK